MSTDHPTALEHTKTFVALHNARAALKEQLETIEEELEIHEGAVIRELERMGLQNVKLTTGKVVYLAHETTAELVKDGEDGIVHAIEAIKRAGFGGQLVQETVHHATLGKWVRDRLAVKKKMPASLRPHILVKERQRVRVRSK